MSITGYSFLFRGKSRTPDNSSERLSHIEIAHHRTGPTVQQSGEHQRQFTLEQSRLKRTLSDRARLCVTTASPPSLSGNIAGDAQNSFDRESRTRTTSHNARPTAQRDHRPDIKTLARSTDSRRTPGINRDGQKQSTRGKPSIVVVHPRAFFRDCFVRCLEISYQSHDVQAFSGIADWRKSEEQTSLTPSVIVFFVDGGNPPNGADLQFLESAAIDIPVVIMSDIDDGNYAMRALKSGARGYIPTSLPFNVAVEAVRLVEAGGTFVPVSSLQLGREPHDSQSKSANLLTERQMMVVEALCQGMANKQIAYELGMSEHTVKVHLRQIMRKLKVRNRTEVAVLTKDFFERENGQRWPDSNKGDQKTLLPS